MYLLSFLPVNGLNFEIGMAWVDLSEPRVHVCLHYSELRFPKNSDRAEFIYVGLYCVVQDSTRFYSFAGLFFYLQGLAT